MDAFQLIGAASNTALTSTGSLQSVVALNVNDSMSVSCLATNGKPGSAQGTITAVQLQ